MAKYVTQEVYDAMKGLTSDKNEFEYLTSVGAAKEAEGYREAAKPKYNVILNYDKELGNTLSGMNSVQAKDLLKEYAVARDEKSILGDIYTGKYGWANSTADADKNKFQTNTAQYYEELASVNPQLADVVKGWDYQQLGSYIDTGKMPEIKKPAPPPAPKVRDIWDVANDIVGYKQGYEGGKKVGVEGYEQNHLDAQALYDELEGMGEDGKALAARLRGSNASDAMAYITANKPVDPMSSEQIATDNHNFFKSQGQRGLDTIYDMYTNPYFGQDIRNAFTGYGTAMANQAAAGAAATNGGNLDSFAEYNKNATDMAYRLAGEDAIENKRKGFATNYFNGYDSVASAMNTNALDFYDYVTDQNQIYSDEKKTMYGYDTERYIADQEAKGIAEQNELNRYTIDKDYDLEMRKLGLNPDGTPMNTAIANGVTPYGTMVKAPGLGGSYKEVVNGDDLKSADDKKNPKKDETVLKYPKLPDEEEKNDKPQTMPVVEYYKLYNGRDDFQKPENAEQVGYDTSVAKKYHTANESPVVAISNLVLAGYVDDAYRYAFAHGYNEEEATKMINAAGGN